MKLEVAVYRDLKEMDYKEIQRFLNRAYREAYRDGRNSVLNEVEKRLETIPAGELRSQYQLGVYDALQAIRKEVE